MPKVANIREGFIQWILRKIMMLEVTTQVIQRVVDRDQRRRGLVLTLRILRVVTDDYADALENMQLIRTALIGSQLAFDILIKRLRLG